MGLVKFLTVRAWVSLALLGWLQVDARGDDYFRCGTHLVERGDTPGAVERACGPATNIRRTKGYVQNGDGTVMTVEYETWTYNLGPVTFSRILVFSDGALASITTGDYGG